MQEYLAESETIDFGHPRISALASRLQREGAPAAYAQRCFGWVRDEIAHSCDRPSEVVACRASAVLEAGVGLCYAKSHLLVALLRARGIAAGFTYQRLQLDQPGRYCLHGLVSVRLGESWYRLDPRGGPRGAGAAFCPPTERLIYSADADGEIDSRAVHPEPLLCIVKALRPDRRMSDVLTALPDDPGLVRA
jgi:hypothetical protein